MNDYYLKDFRKKCRNARLHYAQTKHLNYYPKFGYNFDKDGNEIIDEYSADIVRKIFDLVGNKKLSTCKVAEILNNENIPTRSYYATQILGLKPLQKKRGGSVSFKTKGVREIKPFFADHTAIPKTSKSIMAIKNNKMNN